MAIWHNSKYVQDGDTFLVNDSNRKYLKDIENKKDIRIVETNDFNKYIYDNMYSKIKDVNLIGVTGTNGKTTTCYLMYQMLNKIGVKTAYIGTIGFYCDGVKIDLPNTTPGTDLLYNLILKAKEMGCENVVMEVSSHSLSQDRVHGLKYDAIGVTNLTREHMDYHKTMAEYLYSKSKLTSMTAGKKVSVLNGNDLYYKWFLNENNNNYVLGEDVKIKKIKKSLDGTYFEIDGKKINTSLIGDFNVCNFAMAYEIIKELGYDMNKIINESNSFIPADGRMSKKKFNNNVIFVDYAHTPDAVKKVLKTVNKVKNNGIITVIGSGGNRDKSKRPVMAKMACKYSNKVIFTNDNPRNENEDKIIRDMLKGAKGNYEVIKDRSKAIEKGIDLLNDKNILMILGKGHETYQIIGNDKVHFSDMEEVEKCIDNKKKLT